jgi:hypothetical protein
MIYWQSAASGAGTGPGTLSLRLREAQVRPTAVSWATEWVLACYGADRLARCEAKKGEVRKKQAPPGFTDFKACFTSTQLTDGLR